MKIAINYVKQIKETAEYDFDLKGCPRTDPDSRHFMSDVEMFALTSTQLGTKIEEIIFLEPEKLLDVKVTCQLIDNKSIMKYIADCIGNTRTGSYCQEWRYSGRVLSQFLVEIPGDGEQLFECAVVFAKGTHTLRHLIDELNSKIAELKQHIEKVNGKIVHDKWEGLDFKLR